MNHRFTSLFAAAAIAVLAGCAATKSGDTEDIRFSGFLSSYSGLVRTNDSDLAAFRYVKPSANLASYIGVVIDPPEARMTHAAIAEIGPEDMAYVLGAFDESLRTELGKKFTIVPAAGPGILRVRACLTDADSATGALTPFSRILPAGIVISTAKKVATGTATNVGKVTAEMEIVDSLSGEQFGAAVDRRVGTGVARLTFTDWGDVKAAFDVWAERTAKRLEEKGLRSR